MRMRLIILSVFVVLFSLFSLLLADDYYVEDVYYWEDDQAIQQMMPSYNPRAKEIIFIEDTLSGQPADTVRAILREAPL